MKENKIGIMKEKARENEKYEKAMKK